MTSLTGLLRWLKWLGLSLPLEVSQLLVSLACFTLPLSLQLISPTSLFFYFFFQSNFFTLQLTSKGVVGRKLQGRPLKV